MLKNNIKLTIMVEKIAKWIIYAIVFPYGFICGFVKGLIKLILIHHIIYT